MQKQFTDKLHIFPDSGASICLAGLNFLQKIKNTDLIPCYKNIKAVDSSILTCHGMLPVKFDIGSHTTIQFFIFLFFFFNCDSQPLKGMELQEKEAQKD